MSEFMIRPEAKAIGLSGYGGRKKQTLLTAARHNLREIQKEIGADRRINPERICLNEILSGPEKADEVEALAQAMRDGIGYKPKRRDFNQAHEMLFTLSNNTKLDTRAFFVFCLEFVATEFGHGSVLNAVIHRDEESEAPHLHVLLSPIAEGKYVGSKLITKSSWAELVDKFALAAAKAFGVTVEKTLAGPMRKQVTRAVQDGLKSLIGQYVSDTLMVVILKAAARNPAPFKAAMGITVTPINDGGAEFRRIALSTGKGSQRERTRNPYGFEGEKSDDAPKPYGFEKGKSGGHQKPYGFESDSDGSEKTETILYVVSPKTPTASSQPTTSNDQDGAGLYVDDDGVIHGLDADRVSMGKPQTIPRQPSWHGIYCRHRLRPVGLFSDLAGLSRSTLVAADAGFMLPGSSPTVIRPQLAAAADVAAAAAGLMQGAVRTEYSDMATGLWDESLGEFVQATEVTHAWAASHVSAIKTATDPPFAMEPGDSYVERDADDIYQPNFLEPEEFLAWTD